MVEHSKQHTGGISHGSSHSRCNAEGFCSHQRWLLLRYDMGHFDICSTSRYGEEIVYLSKPQFQFAVPQADFSERDRHVQALHLLLSRNQGTLNGCKDKYRRIQTHRSCLDCRREGMDRLGTGSKSSGSKAPHFV